MPLPRHVYVHVPFCARRCSYCDFAITVRSAVPVDAYLRGIRREVDIRFLATEPWRVDTLYIGGGTPSRLGADGVRDLMSLMSARLVMSADAEVTLEANPEDVTQTNAAAWRDAGVNRLSIGAQSFDDAVLRWMHRTHDAGAIPRAVEVARAAGFTNFSLDLIFALPPEIVRVWPTDLARALALEPTHLSLYGLTVEPHTPLARWRDRGLVAEAPEERYEEEFLRAHEALAAAGFEHYEVSNFGRPGYASRHNGAYWTGSTYAGLGPSAHGFDGAERRWNASGYVDWLARVERGEDPQEGSEQLSDANLLAESVYLGLRSRRGVVVEPAELSRVDAWREAGWCTIDNHLRAVLTPLGWLRLDALAADLTLVRSRC